MIPKEIVNVLVQVKGWLRPPHFPDDEEKNQTVQLANTLGLFSTIVLVIAAIIFVPVFVVHKILAWSIIAGLIFLYVVARWLMFRGEVNLSNVLLVVGAWIVFQGMGIVSGGIYSVRVRAFWE